MASLMVNMGHIMVTEGFLGRGSAHGVATQAANCITRFLASTAYVHPVPQLMNVHKAACASSQDTQALSLWMINAGGSTHECGFSRLE